MDHADQRNLSEFVAAKTNLIHRHADAYAAEIADFRRGDGAENEHALLDDFNHQVESILLSYTPPTSRRAGDSLVFDHLYGDADPARLRTAGEDLQLVTTLSALFAAEVETRGPLRLSRTQDILLAEVYEEIGEHLLRARLPAHAVLAFRQAYRLHTVVEDVRGQDRCGLSQARARTLADPSRLGRLRGRTSDLLCGYGYRPFRLLAWIAVQIALFTIAVVATSHTDPGVAMYLGFISFVNPLGYEDVESTGTVARVILTVEAYTGIVSSSVFFALLVRQLFRL
ncbi:hypothetical protein ACFXK0_02150 [Nocardia sp. NPDC059177]|uniref:hypothetical protein n=1 Tax=Nocardia sp. NPDC059177 TaxID=3346759 RepID=UPI0036CEF0D5